MATELIEKKDSELVKVHDGYISNTLFFPNAELLNIGCVNCVWRLNNQCPYDYPLEDGQMHKEGICMELVYFISSLAEPDDTISAVWEKFLLYKTRLQESADYADFLRLNKEIKEKEKSMDTNGYDQEDKELVEKLRMDRTSAKMWWIRLNQQAILGLQKVRDREVKKSEGTKVAGILRTGSINFNIVKEVDKQ